MIKRMKTTQTDIVEIAERHPQISWGCMICGYHAKSEKSRKDHEEVKGHNQWTSLKWNSRSEMNRAPSTFEFVENVYKKSL